LAKKILLLYTAFEEEEEALSCSVFSSILANKLCQSDLQFPSTLKGGTKASFKLGFFLSPCFEDLGAQDGAMPWTDDHQSGRSYPGPYVAYRLHEMGLDSNKPNQICWDGLNQRALSCNFFYFISGPSQGCQS
jgi:hypothetical protein